MFSVVEFTDISLISVITCSKASRELLWAVLLWVLHSALGEEQAAVVNSRHRDKPPSVASCFLVTAESHADVPHDLGKPLTFSNQVCGRERGRKQSLSPHVFPEAGLFTWITSWTFS